nr:MAG TPA: hypothetical protein [Caudoviricetes sp.]
MITPARRPSWPDSDILSTRVSGVSYQCRVAT